MPVFFLPFIVFLISIIPITVQAETYTMSGAVARALQANPTMEQQVHALERAKMNVGVAQSYFWPRASVVANKTFLRNSGSVGTTDELSSNTQSYGLQVALSLFAGFMHLNTLQQSLIEKDIAALTKRQAELELSTNVKIQFLTYLQAKRNLRLAKDSIKRMETQLKSSEAYVSEDLAPYVNVLQNRVELARGNEELIRSENALETARMQLNRFLGYDPDKKITYKGDIEDFSPKFKYDRQQSVQRALKNRPDVLIAEKSIDVARKRALVAAGDALPKVDVTYNNMNFERDYTNSRYKDYDRQYWSVGLNFTWTFFEGGKAVFSTLAEKKQADAMTAAYKNTVDVARTDVLKAIMDVESALKVYETAKQAIASATESYSQNRERYDMGIGTITELLDSQTKLTEAEVTCSQAMADCQIAHARYVYYIGGEDDQKGTKETSKGKNGSTKK